MENVDQSINLDILSPSFVFEAINEDPEKLKLFKKKLNLISAKPQKTELSLLSLSSVSVPLTKMSPSIKEEVCASLKIQGTEGEFVLVSPSVDVTDELVFSHPSDQTKKYYLPRYCIAEQKVSGNQQFMISLEKADNGGKLIVYLENDLENNPSPNIDYKNVSVMTHKVSIMLSYNLNGSSDLQTKCFNELTLNDNRIEAVLNLNNLKEINEVYNCMTQPEWKSTLSVKREFEVAVPVELSLINSGTYNPDFRRDYDHKQNIISYSNNDFEPPICNYETTTITSYDFGFNFDTGNNTRDSADIIVRCSWMQRQVFDNGYKEIENNEFQMGPIEIVSKDYAKMGFLDKSDFDSILPSDLDPKKTQYKETLMMGPLLMAVHTNLGHLAKVQILNSGMYIGIKWATYLSRKKRPELLVYTFPNSFFFSIDLHPYIYKVIPDSSNRSGLILHRVDDKNYYQDQDQLKNFYYLPDCFKLGRTDRTTPHTLMMYLQNGPDNWILNYAALPYYDEARLKKALGELSQRFSNIKDLELSPLLIDHSKIRFYLKLPEDKGSSEKFQDRSNMALVRIKEGINDLIDLNPEQFYDIYESIIIGDSLFFQGYIEAEVYPDQIETIDFIARVNDTVGPILDHMEEQDIASGGIKTTFINNIESPVDITKFSVTIKKGNLESKGKVTELTLPVTLKSEDRIQFLITPLEQLAGEGDLHAIFNYDLKVRPDPEKVLESIDRGVSPTLSKITIMTPLFDDPEASKGLLAFDVQLFHTTVTLTREHTIEIITPKMTLEDFKKWMSNSEITYRVTEVKKDGSRTTGPERTLEGDTITVYGAD